MRPYLRRFCYALVLVLLGTVLTAAAQVQLAGISRPEGTNLHEASKGFLLIDASWELAKDGS